MDSENPTTREQEWADLQRLREQLRASPGWTIRQQIEGLQRTWNVFYLNWAHLESMVGRFKMDTKFALELWGSVNDRTRWEQFLTALDQPLHNYTTSARTLVEHTRIVARATLSDGAWAEYNNRVQSGFANHPRNQFVDRLRNYMLHYKLPATGGEFHMDHEKGVRFAMVLDRDTLLDWDDWTALPRQFLEDADESIDLHEVLGAHHKDVAELHGWFGRHVAEDNRGVLEEAQRIADDGNVIADKFREIMYGDEK